MFSSNLLILFVTVVTLTKAQEFNSPHGVGLDVSVVHEEDKYPKDCWDILKNYKNNGSGIYVIKPNGFDHPLEALCDMETEGGGWTEIIKRYNGRINFFRGWRWYVHGFGFLDNEFNMGLQFLRALQGNWGSPWTSDQQLLIELVDRKGKVRNATYTNFAIGPEPQSFPLLKADGFSGQAGDSLGYHVGMKFSTRDYDQDNNPNGNCAEEYQGAWWFNNCFQSHLNGKFVDLNLPKAYEYLGVAWKSFRGNNYALAKARMMVKPATTN